MLYEHFEIFQSFTNKIVRLATVKNDLVCDTLRKCKRPAFLQEGPVSNHF